MTARIHALITGLALLLQSYAHNGQHGFVENKGQLRDQHGRPAPEVRYLWPTGQGVNVQVLNNGLSYDTYTKADGHGRFHRIDLRFIGASLAAEVIAASPRSDRMHFIGRDGQQVRDVRHYDALRIQELYPGVDLDLRITGDGSMKYDIVLRNGADLGKVRMRYTGHDALALRDGDLALAIGDREFTETIPASWTGADRKPVRVAYTVLEQHADHAVLGLKRLDPIDSPRLLSLTVDPAIIFDWGTYFGGDQEESANAVAIDQVGMIYMAGRTGELLTEVTTGGFQAEFGGGTRDAFLAKVAPHGSRLWTTYFGGEGDDEALGVAVGPDYSIALVGSTTSLQGIATDSAAQVLHAGGEDAFIALLDTMGLLQWSTYLGGIGLDRAHAVRFRPGGGIVVCGTTDSPTVFDNVGGTPLLAFADSLDAFVARFSVLGALLHATCLGGAGNDELVAIEIDASGISYLAGRTSSMLALDTSSAALGGSDAWVCALDTGLAVLWSRQLGADADDAFRSVARRGNRIVACGYQSATMQADTADTSAVIQGPSDALIVRLLADGTIEGIQLYGGEGHDCATGIAASWGGQLLVVGTTDSHLGISFPAVPYDTLRGGTDGFLVLLNLDDNVMRARYFGGIEDDLPSALAVYGFSHGNMAGTTASSSGIAWEGFQMAHGGDTDAFLTRHELDMSTPCVGISSNGYGGNCPGGGCTAWNNWCSGNGYPVPPFPQMHLCRGDTVTLCTSGGSLAFGHYWMWYADECGDPQHFLAIGECITFVADEDFTLWVRTENPNMTGPCTGVALFVHDKPESFASAPANVCLGDSIPLSGGGGYSHLWQGPDSFAVPDSQAFAPSTGMSGTVSFTLTAFSIMGCASDTTVHVNIIAVPALPFTATDVTCHGGSDGALGVDSLAAAPFAITWSPAVGAGTAIDGLLAGAYIATITDTLGCSRSDTLVVAQPIHPLDTMMVTTATCGRPNGAIAVLLHASAGEYDFTWTPDAGNGSAIAGLSAGAYTAQYENALGCVYTLTALVSDTGSIVAAVTTGPITILLGDSTELIASHMPYDPQASIVWSPSDGLSCAACAVTMAAPTADALYTVLIANTLGCIAIDSVLVLVEIPPDPAFFLPTHFSPNADGLNDLFEPLGGVYARMRLVITDREGHEVFVGDGERPVWDGSVRGAAARQGVYTILLECERRDGGIDTHRAQLHLVR